MTRSFRRFAAIDWSGAVGERHKGIAVALCAAGVEAPALVRPGHRWSRREVLDWLCNTEGLTLCRRERGRYVRDPRGITDLIADMLAFDREALAYEAQEAAQWRQQREATEEGSPAAEPVNSESEVHGGY